MSETNQNSTPHGWNEDAATEYEREKYGTPGTSETKSPTIEPSEQDDDVDVRPKASIGQYLTSAMVESPSMNLLDDTAKHLHGLMKKATPETQDMSQTQSADMVNAVCNAAKNIREIMKLKLDAMKLQHEVNKETGVYKEARK